MKGERKERDYQSANLALNGQRAIGHDDATNERKRREESGSNTPISSSSPSRIRKPIITLSPTSRKTLHCASDLHIGCNCGYRITKNTDVEKGKVKVAWFRLCSFWHVCRDTSRTRFPNLWWIVELGVQPAGCEELREEWVWVPALFPPSFFTWVILRKAFSIRQISVWAFPGTTLLEEEKQEKGMNFTE